LLVFDHTHAREVLPTRYETAFSNSSLLYLQCSLGGLLQVYHLSAPYFQVCDCNLLSPAISTFSPGTLGPWCANTSKPARRCTSLVWTSTINITRQNESVTPPRPLPTRRLRQPRRMMKIRPLRLLTEAVFLENFHLNLIGLLIQG
jgi:hypothetical protein